LTIFQIFPKMNLYANQRRWINLAREFFFPAKLNAFPVFLLKAIISQSDSSLVYVTNGIESRRRFYGFPSACSILMPSHVSSMKSTVFSQTRVYLFATRSTFDPLKRDSYGMKKQRLAFPIDLRDRIDCHAVSRFSTRRGIDVPGDFTGIRQWEPRPCGDTTFLRLGEINWNPEGGCDPVICGAKETPPREVTF